AFYPSFFCYPVCFFTGREAFIRFILYLSGVNLGGLAHDYGHLLMEQATAIRVAQFYIVGTGSKRELFGLLNPVGKAAIDINRSILMVGLDFDVSEVGRHVVRLIGVGIRI